MSAGVNGLYSEEGQIWMRVSPGHAISEQWLEERAPDLYARWWEAPSVGARDQVALQIEKHVEEWRRPSRGSSWRCSTRSRRRGRRSPTGLRGTRLRRRG